MSLRITSEGEKRLKLYLKGGFREPREKLPSQTGGWLTQFSPFYWIFHGNQYTRFGHREKFREIIAREECEDRNLKEGREKGKVVRARTALHAFLKMQQSEVYFAADSDVASFIVV